MEPIQKSWSWKAWFSSWVFSSAAPTAADLPVPEWGRWQDYRAQGAQGTVKPAGSAAFWKLSSVFGCFSTATKAEKEQKVLLPLVYVQIKEDSFLYSYFLNQYFKSFLIHKAESTISNITSIWTGIKIFLSKVSSPSYSSTNIVVRFCFSAPSSLD